MLLCSRQAARSLALLAVLALLLARAPIAESSSSPTVLINEFMPNPSSGSEWVELFNPGASIVDLSGWKIDDEVIGGSPAPTTIASGVAIPPNGLLVISLAANILNNTGSDVVRLLDPADGTVDSRAYSGTSVGESYARVPDGGTSWLKGPPSPDQWNSPPGPSPLPTSTPTITSSPTAAPSSTPSPSPTATAYPTGITLNEFLAYPKVLYVKEWVELRNDGLAEVDLAGWKIDDDADGASPYVLPSSTTIAPDGFLLVNLPSAIFNNDGDVVRLLRPDGTEVSSTDYSSADPDVSRSRAADGSWYDSPTPSPGASNPPVGLDPPASHATSTNPSTSRTVRSACAAIAMS